MGTVAKIEKRQNQFRGFDMKLVSKQGKTLKDWCKPSELDAFLQKNGFRRMQSGLYESDATKLEATDGDLPIGTPKMKTGNGVNNYAMPSLSVQGCADRLTATKHDDWPFPDDEEEDK
jgi:hypothetical protein